MKLFFHGFPLRINHRHLNLCAIFIVARLISDLRLFPCRHHIHFVLAHVRISGGIIHDTFPHLDIVVFPGKGAAPLAGNIAVPRDGPAQPILPYRKNRISLVPRYDNRSGCCLCRSGNITINHRPAIVKKIIRQFMAHPHFQRKYAVLNVTVASQKDLSGKDFGYIACQIRIIISAAAFVCQLFQKLCIGKTSHRHSGERDPLFRTGIYHILKIIRLSHTVRQKHHMLDGRLIFRDLPARLQKSRLNGRSAALSDMRDLILNSCLILRHSQFHLPVIPVIKSQNAYIIRLSQVIYRHTGSPDGKIQIAAAGIHGLTDHASRMVNDHHHSHGWDLIQTPRLHIHRKHCLKHGVPISAQRKTFLTSAADKTAPVILHISL